MQNEKQKPEEKITKDDELFGEAIDLMQEFVDRVEAGTVHSVYTYNKFKELLKKHRGE